MSYRAFKRLLGETSLERKCRWLLGAGVLRPHDRQLLGLRPADRGPRLRPARDDRPRAALARSSPGCTSPATTRRPWTSFQQARRGGTGPRTLKGYSYQLVKPVPERPRHAADQRRPGRSCTAFQNDPDKNEDTRQAPKENAFYYYGADPGRAVVRRLPPRPGEGRRASSPLAEPEAGRPDGGRRASGCPTQSIEEGFHTNRACSSRSPSARRCSSWPAATSSSATSSSSRSST